MAAFTCDFVPHDCTHREVFRANYQRTNRTKDSKILRCFPHCCPGHVSRSFCGAPLYLDVHWRPPKSGESAGAVPLLLVFGRFRLAQERGVAVGERLAPEAIAQSVQSDDNPNGHWIKSALVEGPRNISDAQPWRFEVNSSARWFYGWESGVAKSHRLREHVLDVLVTTPEPPSGDGTAIEWLRVVAAAHSPPFKMISFRRATPEALSLLSASSATTVPLPPPTAGTPITLDDLHSHTQRTKHSLNHRSKPHNDAARRTERRAVAHALADVKCRLSELPDRRESVAKARQPLPTAAVASALHPAAQARDLAIVWTFLQQIPLRRAVLLTPAMERVFWGRLARHDGDDDGPRRRLRHDGDSRPDSLLEIACHVVLWLWWDDTLHAQWRELVDAATDVLLDGRALRRRFERRVVGWLWTQLDAFLARADWTLDALVESIAHETRNTPTPPAVTEEAEAFAAAYEAFVAHVRERFVDQQRAADTRRYSAKRRRLGQPSPTRFLEDQGSASDGEWLADVSDLRIDPPTRPEGYLHGNGGARPWRLVHLLCFWREFSALRVQLDASSATLRVHSLVARLADDPESQRGADDADDAVLALVLDHRCRWARHLPSGASTLAVPLAGCHLGDYVGKVSPSGHEIHLNCYAWPTVADADAHCGGGGCLWASCYQVHLRAVSPDALLVRVTVNRGRVDPRALGLDRRASAVAREVHLRPLRHKLSAVAQWHASGEWQWAFARATGA